MNITGTHFLLLSRLQAKTVTLCGRYSDDAYFRKQGHTQNKKIKQYIDSTLFAVALSCMHHNGLTHKRNKY